MAVRLLMAARVVAAAWPSSSTRELTFEPVHRSSFPAFVPGDHVQLQHDDGTRRDYSLIGRTDGASYTVAIRRDEYGRGGSVLFHDSLAVGDILYVSYPQAGMRLDPVDRHVFIAGGIGITAVLAMAESAPPGQKVEVHYCVRTRADAAYLGSFARPGTQVFVHESSVDGRVDFSEMLRDVPAATSLYYCGPEGMMNAIAHASSHWPAQRIHTEAFTGTVTAGESLGEAFDVWLALSQRVIRVEETESLLQAMRREGVPLEYACEGGACGSCVLELIGGTVEHRDVCLSDGERTTFLTACVSRGRGPIKVQA